MNAPGLWGFAPKCAACGQTSLQRGDVTLGWINWGLGFPSLGLTGFGIAKLQFNKFWDSKVWVLWVLGFQSLSLTGFGIPKFEFNGFGDFKVWI